MLDVERYRWLEDDRYDAITVAVIEGVAEDEVIRCYGGDPATSTPAGFEDSMGYLDADFFVRTLTEGGRVAAIENNGWTGSICEFARRITAGGGRFASVYWCGAIGVLSVLYAEDGVVTGYHRDGACGSEVAPPAVPEWERALAADGEPVSPAIALIDRLMGVEIRQEWFLGPGRTTKIPDFDSLLPQKVIGTYGTGEDIVRGDPAAYAP